MTIAPAETVLERVETTSGFHQTMHIWHSKCQGLQPGPKHCYCGHKLNITEPGVNWTGKKVLAEDCIVCMDLQAKALCPVCGVQP